MERKDILMKFSEILSRPLPSAQNRTFTESEDIIGEGTCREAGCGSEGCNTEKGCGEGCNSEGCRSEKGCGEGCGPEGCEPKEPCDPADPTCNQPIPPIQMQEPVPDPIKDDEDVVLSPEEDRRVDDTINAVATPLLLNTEMTESELEEFIESIESDIMVGEGFLTEKTIVRFDKNAKRAQLFEVAVAACAREHKDPLYKKLETVYKMERTIKAKLRKKYRNEANRKVKEYLQRAKKSKSNVLVRIANKITGK